MNNLRKTIILIVGVLLSCSAWAQEVSPLRVEKRYTFYFRVNSDKIDEDYMGNSETIAKMQEELAMALETPVVATSVGAIPDMLDGCGIIVEPCNVSDRKSVV